MLREYTRTVHAAIESERDILNRLKTREDYAAILERYLASLPSRPKTVGILPLERIDKFQHIR